MANKAGGVGINCLAEDVVTADWQRQMTLVLTPAAWTGKILNHRDLWRWRSWEEMPVKQQHNPELRFSPPERLWRFDPMSKGYVSFTSQTRRKYSS